VLKGVASHPVPKMTNKNHENIRQDSQSPGRISEPEILKIRSKKNNHWISMFGKKT
jgi:hypothetical protein